MDEFRQRVRECEICGGPMVKKGARAKYCSRECYGKSKTLKALERSPAKECVLCGKEFRSKDPGAIFCGRKCYVASLRGGEDKECAYCGEVMPWNSPWECCSVQCAGLLRRVRNEKRSSTCLQCGKFILMKTAQSKFCSPSCAYEYRSAPLIEDQCCLNCGKEILSRKKRVFCNNKCSGEYRKGRPTGPKDKVTLCFLCREPIVGAAVNQRYCSRKCYDQERANRPVKTGTCSFCEVEFVKSRPEQIFCSRECFGRSRRTKPPKSDNHRRSRIQRGGMTEREYDVYLLLDELVQGTFYHNLRLAPMGAVKGKIYYLLDFADPVRKLNIEVDGPEHFVEDKLEADKVRDEWLTSQGWTILRVTNEEVLSSIDSVQEKIRSLVTT